MRDEDRLRLINIHESRSLLVEFCNEKDVDEKSLLDVGFQNWLNPADEKSICEIIQTKREVVIQWPTNFQYNGAHSKSKLRNAVFQPTLVNILSCGELSVMKEKLVNMVKLDVLSPLKEDRSSRKRIIRPEYVNDIKKTKIDVMSKVKTIPAHTSDDVLLGRLKSNVLPHVMIDDNFDSDDKVVSTKKHNKKVVDTDEEIEGNESDDDAIDDNEANEMEDLLRSKDEELERKTNEIDSLHKKIDKLENDLKNKEIENNGLKTDLKKCRNELQACNAQLKLTQINENISSVVQDVLLIKDTAEKAYLKLQPAVSPRTPFLDLSNRRDNASIMPPISPQYEEISEEQLLGAPIDNSITPNESKKRRKTAYPVPTSYSIDKELLKKVNKASVQTFTNDILEVLFTSEELASSSVTGKICNANKHLNKEVRPGLDVDKLNAARNDKEMLNGVASDLNNLIPTVQIEKIADTSLNSEILSTSHIDSYNFQRNDNTPDDINDKAMFNGVASDLNNLISTVQLEKIADTSLNSEILSTSHIDSCNFQKNNNTPDNINDKALLNGVVRDLNNLIPTVQLEKIAYTSLNSEILSTSHIDSYNFQKNDNTPDNINDKAMFNGVASDLNNLISTVQLEKIADTSLNSEILSTSHIDSCNFQKNDNTPDNITHLTMMNNSSIDIQSLPIDLEDTPFSDGEHSIEKGFPKNGTIVVESEGINFKFYMESNNGLEDNSGNEKSIDSSVNHQQLDGDVDEPIENVTNITSENYGSEDLSNEEKENNANNSNENISRDSSNGKVLQEQIKSAEYIIDNKIKKKRESGGLNLKYLNESNNGLDVGSGNEKSIDNSDDNQESDIDLDESHKNVTNTTNKNYDNENLLNEEIENDANKFNNNISKGSSNGKVQQQRKSAEYIIDTKAKTKKAILKVHSDGNYNLTNVNVNLPGTPKVDMSKQYVSRIKSNKKRESKPHCCTFCKKLIKDQIRRHIKTVHGKEDVVKQAQRMGKITQDQILTDLINIGDYWYNYERVPGSEEVVEKLVSRRPNKRQVLKPKTTTDGEAYILPPAVVDKQNVTLFIDEKTKLPVIHNYNLPATEKGTEFVPCSYCFVSFRKSNLRKHRCPRRPELRDVRGILKESRSLIPDVNALASERLRTLVLKVMTEDEVKEVVKSDELIVLFGNDMAEYYNKDQNYQMISHHLRVLGELQLLVQQINPDIIQLSQLLDNSYVSIASDAIKKMLGYDPLSATISKGNKCREISALMNKIVDFYINRCSEKNLDETIKRAKKFRSMLQEKMKHLNKKARDCLIDQAKKKPQKSIPKVDDIKKLGEYAENIRIRAFKVLSKKYDYHEWRNLNESTLLLLQLFNRKRQGEISRLLLDDLSQSSLYCLDDVCDGDEFTKLNEESKIAAKDYIRVSIINKKGLKVVGLIIHKNYLNGINLILKYREQAGVLNKNKYVFGKQSIDQTTDKYFIGCDIMRKYSRECGVEHHFTLRGTLLRKQLATMMYGIGLEDTRLQDLANFLGHDYEIHKAYYRQKIPARELLAITPLLQRAQGMTNHSVEIDSASSNTQLQTIQSSSKTNESKLENVDLNSESAKVVSNVEKRVRTVQNPSLNSSEDSTYKPDSQSEESASDLDTSNRKNFFDIRKQKQTETKKKKPKKRRHSSGDDEEVEKKKNKRTPWTTAERDAVQNYIDENGLPTRTTTAVLKIIQDKYPILKSRDILTIRSYFHNTYQLKKKL